MNDLTSEQITAALRDAYMFALSDDVRRGVMLAAVELGVRAFPGYREYQAWLESIRRPPQHCPHCGAASGMLHRRKACGDGVVPWNACACGKCAVCLNREVQP